MNTETVISEEMFSFIKQEPFTDTLRLPTLNLEDGLPLIIIVNAVCAVSLFRHFPASKKTQSWISRNFDYLCYKGRNPFHLSLHSQHAA